VASPTPSHSGTTEGPDSFAAPPATGNSSSLNMLKVATAVEEIMAARSEEEKIVVVIRIVLKLMKQNGC
jgi:hypothetical protein